MLVVALIPGCDRGPARAADRFAEAYFVEASQHKALEVATGLAERKLRDEIALLAGVRAGGANARAARSSIRMRRAEVNEAKESAEVRYELTVESASGALAQRALVMLRRVDGAWRVSNWSLFHGVAPGPVGASRPGEAAPAPQVE